eukprot:8420798-Ditylum_brightwellii.AAC.1
MKQKVLQWPIWAVDDVLAAQVSSIPSIYAKQHFCGYIAGNLLWKQCDADALQRQLAESPVHHWCNDDGL